MADIATTALQTCINQWSAALQTDSASPQPSYEIDGKKVSRDEWREKLLKDIKQAQDVINQRNPSIVWQTIGNCFSGWW